MVAEGQPGIPIIPIIPYPIFLLEIYGFPPKSPKNDYYRSEGFALTGYDIPGCMEDGAWMLWENSSVVVAVVAHPGLGGEREFGFSQNQITKMRRRAHFCDLIS